MNSDLFAEWQTENTLFGREESAIDIRLNNPFYTSIFFFCELVRALFARVNRLKGQRHDTVRITSKGRKRPMTDRVDGARVWIFNGVLEMET